MNRNSIIRKWREISKKGRGAAKNTMMRVETEDSDEEGGKIAITCIIEEVNLGKAIRPGEEKHS